MKYIPLIALLLSVVLLRCSEKTKVSRLHNVMDPVLMIPDTTVDKSVLTYNNKVSQWTLEGQLYSGYAVSFYQDSSLKERVGFFDGKKENQSTLWHPDGHFKQLANYSRGKLHGVEKVWSPDSSHALISQLNYRLGKPHGEQKKWYMTGELHKKLNLNMGKEEGIQQAFRKNGDLYANYEAREGRIFGLKKAALCYGLEEESIQFEN